MEDVNVCIVVFDILFEEFIELSDEFGFLHQQTVIFLKNRDGGSVRNDFLKDEKRQYKRNKKNEIIKNKMRYLFVASGDFCFAVVHRKIASDDKRHNISDIYNFSHPFVNN